MWMGVFGVISGGGVRPSVEGVLTVEIPESKSDEFIE
jgi:hypothetical protein